MAQNNPPEEFIPLEERGLSLPHYGGGGGGDADGATAKKQEEGKGDAPRGVVVVPSSASPQGRYGAVDSSPSAPAPKMPPPDGMDLDGVVGRSSAGGAGGTATLLSCAVNLTNTIVGAGMLGLPGAFGGTGYVGGPLLVFVGAAFSAHGLVLLAKAAVQVDDYPSSFYTVAHAAVPRYTVLIDLAVALKCFGVATGYLITVADCMIDALDHVLLPDGGDPATNWWTRLLLSRRFWVAGAALGVLPVSFYRSFDKLKTASAVALGFVFMLAAGIVAYANGWAGDPCLGYDPDDNGGRPCVGEAVAFTDGPTAASKLPIFIFAFTCQQNIFPIVNEIRRRSISRVSTVVVIAIGFALGIFLIVAMEGYLTYGDSVKGDILLNYPEDGKVTFMRMCIAVMLMLHYPLQLDPSRRCIMSLLKVVAGWVRSYETGKGRERQHDYEEFNDDDNNKAIAASSEDAWTDDDRSAAAVGKDGKKRGEDDAGPNDTLFLAVTFTFLLSSFGIALAVDDLGIVLALVGATGSTLVSYVLPGLIYVKVQRKMSPAKMMAYVQLGVGCLVMPTALYFVLSGDARE